MTVEFLSRLQDDEIAAIASTFDAVRDPTLFAHVVVAHLATGAEKHDYLTLSSACARVAFARRVLAR